MENQDSRTKSQESKKMGETHLIIVGLLNIY